MGQGLKEVSEQINDIVIDGSNVYVAVTPNINGQFVNIGGVDIKGVGKWDGTQWTSLIDDLAAVPNTHQFNTLVIDGTALYVAGRFPDFNNTTYNNIACYDITNVTWTALGTGLTGGLPLVVNDMVADGQGDLFVVGGFEDAGGEEVDNAAMWDGADWFSMFGSNLILITSPPRAVVYDFQRKLVTIGGADFRIQPPGGLPPEDLKGIAQYDPVASMWFKLGGGIVSGNELPEGVVTSLAHFGFGNDLIVGGDIAQVLDPPMPPNPPVFVSVNNIASWNGTNWSALANGANGTVEGLFGDLTSLIAVGLFSSPGNSIAVWDGANWSSPGLGIDTNATSTSASPVAVAKRGADLFVSGRFVTAGGKPSSSIALFRGAGADLALDITATSATVLLGNPIIYDITVENFGPEDASGVAVENILPTTAQITAITTEKTFRFIKGGTMTMATTQLGNIPAGESKGFKLEAMPEEVGTVVHIGTVTGSDDPNPGNNETSEETRVISPGIAFIVDPEGNMKIRGMLITMGADFAEMWPISTSHDPTRLGRIEPGHVLSLGPDGGAVFARAPNALEPIGIVSTDPGILTPGPEGLEAEITDQKIPLAMKGIVPVKVTDEGGAIRPGDVLTVSSKPGHAMKASPENLNGLTFYPSGSILGKAIEKFNGADGVIRVVLTLQ